MYYYKQEEDKIVKYEITLNKEVLKSLRWEIIEYCSLITHERYKTTKTPNQFDFEHIRNYKEKLIGVIEYNDFYSMPEDEYLVEYDYYKHPRLVSLIDDLLLGKIDVIDEIINPNIKEDDEEKLLLKEQSSIIKKLTNKKNKDISNEIELLKENQEKLIKYKEKCELNKNQISVVPYYKKVLNCIEFKEIDSINLSVVNEYQKFFRYGKSDSFDINTEKVLKLNKETKKCSFFD